MSVDFKAINKAFKDSMNRNHASAGMQLRRVWSMEIEGAASAFRSDLKPIQRLWHGTKDANLLSLLRGGYVIPGRSSSIAVTGRMYGDGVYFSDQSTKSLNYATGSAPGQYGHSGSQRKFMIFNDVAMGRIFRATHSFSGGCPVGFDSCFAEAGKSGVRNNEMIVFKTYQACPIRLIEFTPYGK
jgi:poly [ADP-ribose] polymerase